MVKKNSLFINLIKSTTICNQPLRPIIPGPNLRCVWANNLRSVKTTNKHNKIIVNTVSKNNSDKLYFNFIIINKYLNNIYI